MSKFIEFDDKHYNFNGLVQLIKGDDISLKATIKESLRGASRVVNLNDQSIVAATAFFKGEEDATITTEVDLGECDHFNIEIPASGSESLAVSSLGSDMFMTIKDSDGDIETIFSRPNQIGVYERNFNRL